MFFNFPLAVESHLRNKKYKTDIGKVLCFEGRLGVVFPSQTSFSAVPSPHFKWSLKPSDGILGLCRDLV
jgi:hypothetical protein